MRLIIPIFILFTSTTTRAELDTRTGYDASNSIAPNHHRCISPTTQSISHCCSTADTCLGDTLCLNQFGTLYVGSCTIKDWKDGANGKGSCPKYCANDGSDIGLCSWNNGWEFCCGLLGKGSEGCCKGERFKLDGNATNEFAVQRPWNADAVVEPVTPSSTAVASQCPTMPINGTGDGNEKENKTPASQIGLGVGLGVPLLIALGLLFLENRKRLLVEARLEMSQGELLVGHAHAGYVASGEGKHRAYVGVESHEVDGSERGNELPSDRSLYELAQVGTQLS